MEIRNENKLPHIHNFRESRIELLCTHSTHSFMNEETELYLNKVYSNSYCIMSVKNESKSV